MISRALQDAEAKDLRRVRHIAHRSWKWNDRDHFQWQGIQFHFHDEYVAYIGVVWMKTSDGRSVFARFLVRRDHNQAWFARAWAKGHRRKPVGRDVLVSAIDERPNASPPGALKAVRREILQECDRLYSEAMDHRFLWDVIGDIRWGFRGQRAR